MGDQPVAYVLKKAERTLIWPFIIFFGGAILLIFLAEKYQLSVLWAAVLIPGLLIAAIMTGSYKFNKWRLWAYQEVDDLEELLRREQKQLLFGKSGAPGKWTLMSVNDREQLKNILINRRNSRNLTKETGYDPNVPPEITVTGSKLNYMIQFVVFALAAPAGWYFQRKKGITEPSVSFLLVPLLLAGIAVYQLYRFFRPAVVFKITETSYQDKENKQIMWNQIRQIYLEDGDLLDNRNGKQEFLIIDYWSGSANRSLQKSIRNTSIKSSELEKAIKVYLARYNKNALTKLTFGKKAV